VLPALAALVLATSTAGAASTGIVISQVYGGGGNSGSVYRNDFVELFNLGSSAINLAGMSVQYASATGTSWLVTNLTGTIQPGQYYLVQEAAGAGGTTNLPTPDATGTIAMGATAGKVALVGSTLALTVACPSGPTIIDFVGYGSTANCSETAPTPAPSNANSVERSEECADIDNNGTEFAAIAASPRNSASPLNVCTPTGVTPGSWGRIKRLYR
jgi:predicted extracellular nuclease